MKKKVLVFGATGFVGTLVLDVLKTYPFDLGILLREMKDKSVFEKEGITVFPGDISDEKSIIDALQTFKPDVVVHLVGIIEEKKPAITFKSIHVEGTQHIISACKKAGIAKILYVSALGASLSAPTPYFQTKAQAEALVQKSGMHWTIFRPSIIFGKHAGFTNQLIQAFRFLPFLPVIGSGQYPFMPIAGKAVGECIAQAVTKEKTNGKIYELYGPETLSIKELTKRLKIAIHSNRPLISIPLPFIQLIAYLSSFGIPVPITKDQLTMLLLGSTTSDKSMERDFTTPSIHFDPNGSYPIF